MSGRFAVRPPNMKEQREASPLCDGDIAEREIDDGRFVPGLGVRVFGSVRDLSLVSERSQR